MKNLIVYKPNQLIEIVGNPISSGGLVAYNFLLHKFQQEKTDKIIISMSEIFNTLEISDKYEDLYNYLNSLQKIRVQSKDTKGKVWGSFSLLAEYKKVDAGIFIQIPNTIFKALCGDEKEKDFYYTTIKLLEQTAYKCSYTIIFYEIFKKYEKINLPIYSIDELKEITGTKEKYGEYKDFKRYVLIRVIEEINRFDSKYDYSFEEKKLGRKVNAIKFLKVEKNVIDLLDKELSEKLVKTIEKARKNRFIDLVYSQKAMDKIITKYEEADVIKGLNELYKYNSEIKNFSKILISK
ncbi:MAG: replication initiation protein, partial [Cetobacterium sp.]